MRSRVAKVCSFSFGVIVALLALAGNAMAGAPASVPEITPGSITAGLGLLTAGVLIVRSRRRSK